MHILIWYNPYIITYSKLPVLGYSTLSAHFIYILIVIIFTILQTNLSHYCTK